MQSAQVLQRQPLERNDEPGDISAGVCRTILIQVYCRRTPTAEDHVLRDVAAMPGAGFNGAKVGYRSPQFFEQQLGLAGERLPAAHHQVYPIPVTGELPAEVGHFAERWSCRMESSQPLRAPLGGNQALVRAAVQEDLFCRRPLKHFFQPDSQRGQVDERLWNRELRLRAKAGSTQGCHGLEDFGAVHLINFRNHAMPPTLASHCDLKGTAVPVPFERSGSYLLPSPALPLGEAKPIELAAEFFPVEHGRKSGHAIIHIGPSQFELHSCSYWGRSVTQSRSVPREHVPARS